MLCWVQQMGVHIIPNNGSFSSKEPKLGKPAYRKWIWKKHNGNCPCKMFEQKDINPSLMVPWLEVKKKKLLFGTENSYVSLCHIPHSLSGPTVAVCFWKDPYLRTNSVVWDLFYLITKGTNNESNRFFQLTWNLSVVALCCWSWETNSVLLTPNGYL